MGCIILKIKTTIAAVAAIAATACNSSDPEIPQNPEPIIGKEVSTNIIYQVNPRFFGEIDCLDGVISHLSRISDMNCDILWIMPIYETGEFRGIGSPYCIRDFTSVNPRYGSIEDMKVLVNSAHEKGMKVILDWVANHTAWDCPWITEHPDWYKKDAAGNIISPNGWTDVAQLEFGNASLREAMKSSMIFWVNQLGIDGFRCDYADGVPHDFWCDVIRELKSINPHMIMLAETGDPAYFNDGFDLVYDWSSATAISSVFKGGKPMEVVKQAQEVIKHVPDGKSILRYVFNHDVAAENNVATMFGSPEGLPVAYVLASMLNGTPMIYSSMDVEGVTGKLSFFDYKSLDFSTTRCNEYKAINSAFRASADVRRGELRDYSNSSVVCFTRSIPGHNLLVVVNPTRNVQTIRAPISLTGQTMTDLIEKKSYTVPVMIELEAYSYLILNN